MSRFVNINPKPLKESDFVKAATIIGCEIAAVKSVAEIESGHLGGYFASGRPVILFESRLFNNFTDGKFLHSHPHLATMRWIRNYRRGEAEYERLEEAMKLNHEAALKSCSWGRFQILGANFARLKFKSVDEYVNSVINGGEAAHLNHFVQFVMTGGLDDELRRLDWHGFSRVYNGPGYRKNNYAKRMQTAYDRFRGGDNLMYNGRLMTNDNLQECLIKHGMMKPAQLDGIIGPTTRNALVAFETANGLVPNGIVDGNEWGALLNEAAP
jgi:hypothetical protein